MKRQTSSKRSTTARGRFLESVIRSMHEFPSHAVHQNVRMPCLTNPKRAREIDVLIQGSLAGYPVRIAIECKNYKAPIGVEKIDGFVGKLNEVGVPHCQSIFVSTSRFTMGAIDRARAVGMRTFLLTGLNSKDLELQVEAAVQSIVYLMPVVLNTRFENDVTREMSVIEAHALFDESGNLAAHFLDLIWHLWMNGSMPSSLGEHDFSLTLPAGLTQLVDGKRVVPRKTAVRVGVVGFVIQVSGKGSQVTLLDAEQEKPERFHVDLAFSSDSSTKQALRFETEAALKDFLEKRPEQHRLTGHVRLPRIRWGDLFYPPTTGLLNHLQRLRAAGVQPEDIDPTQYADAELSSAWDPFASPELSVHEKRF